MSSSNPPTTSVYAFLWANISPYKWHYAVMLLAPFLSSFYDFANNYAIKLVVDGFSSNETLSFSELALPITLFLVAQVLLDVFWRIADVAEWRSEPYVRQAIISQTYSIVQNHPYPFFQNTPSGSITSRLKGILDGYDHFWAAMHHEFTPKVANTIVLAGVLAVVNVKVCLFVSLWGLIFFVVMYRFATVLDRLSLITSNHRHSIFGLVADNISNIFTIFSFATKQRELQRLNNAIEKDFIPSNIKLYRFTFLARSVAAVMYWGMLAALFLYMIHLLQIKEASTGDFVFVMGITLKMCMELWQLIHKMQDFMKNIGDLKSAFQLITIAQDAKDTASLKSLDVKEPRIRFEDLSFAYETGKPVFQHLSLSIKPGEKIGLVGTSGAGKSTMVSLLLKYFHPNKGRIFIDNQEIATVSTDSVRQKIAVIPQDIMLFHRSIFENIRYGNLDASKEDVIKAAQMANIHEFILSLPEQYDSLVGERGVKLSGGQRQRIAIARAILKNAPILVLDEATSRLDTETEQLIQSSLNQLLNDSKTTVLAIAHRLSTLKHMDRIIVLEQGKVVEEGSHDELINRGHRYYKLWEMQKNGLI